MRRLFFAVVVILLSDYAVQAQDTYTDKSPSMKNNFKWNIGLEPAVPVGNFHNFSNFGLGGSFQGEYRPGKLGITLSAGYVNYFGKTVDTIEYANFKYWPVMGGLKLHMSGKSYLHGEAGAGFGEKDLGTSFWYGAGVGFELGRACDLEFKYTGWNQNEISKSSNGNGGYNGGGTGGGGGGGGYGGHYSTLSVRLAYVFR
jgi:hypothetical protein